MTNKDGQSSHICDLVWARNDGQFRNGLCQHQRQAASQAAHCQEHHLLPAQFCANMKQLQYFESDGTGARASSPCGMGLGRADKPCTPLMAILLKWPSQMAFTNGGLTCEDWKIVPITRMHSIQSRQVVTQVLLLTALSRCTCCPRPPAYNC